MKPKFIRLDKLITDRKLVESRTLAQEYIESGRVSVENTIVTKPASMVSPEASIKIDTPEKQWVSRGAHKLLKAIDFFGISPKDRVCIDIGASTGGFTDVLLSSGAAKVYAVDVGYGQLAWKLRTDERVVVMERTNARFLTGEMFPDGKADIIVSDASFISLKLLLNPLEPLLKDEGLMSVLVKPQFEVGKERVGKGVVSDPSLHKDVLNELSDFIDKETNLKLLDATFSPIRGPEGNIEFLFLLGHKNIQCKSAKIIDMETLVSEAHIVTASAAEESRMTPNAK